MTSGATSASTGSRASNRQRVAAENGESPYTTIMFKNVPRKYTPQSLLAQVQAIADREFIDFVYLPWDAATSGNMGFGFVNFTDSEVARDASAILSRTFWTPRSARHIKVAPAFVQGLAANLAHCAYKVPADASHEHLPLVWHESELIDFHAAVRLYATSRSGAKAKRQSRKQPAAPQPAMQQPAMQHAPQHAPQQQQQRQHFEQTVFDANRLHQDFAFADFATSTVDTEWQDWTARSTFNSVGSAASGAETRQTWVHAEASVQSSSSLQWSQAPRSTCGLSQGVSRSTYGSSVSTMAPPMSNQGVSRSTCGSSGSTMAPPMSNQGASRSTYCMGSTMAAPMSNQGASRSTYGSGASTMARADTSAGAARTTWMGPEMGWMNFERISASTEDGVKDEPKEFQQFAARLTPTDFAPMMTTAEFPPRLTPGGYVPKAQAEPSDPMTAASPDAVCDSVVDMKLSAKYQSASVRTTAQMLQLMARMGGSGR